MLATLLLLTVASEGAKVLVVANELRPDGFPVAEHYLKRRAIPRSNYLVVRTAPNDDVDTPLYLRQILTPIRRKLQDLKGIESIVLIHGMPLRLDNKHGNSVDSMLAAMDIEGDTSPLPNPYFQSSKPYARATAKIFLVCRLDGRTPEDAIALVDRSLAAKPSRAPILLDGHTSRAPGYGEMNASLEAAGKRLKARGVPARWDGTDAFQSASEPLMGYAGWGSNDSRFDANAYRSLRFVPGAIAETFVSTSARTFRKVEGGQSTIADLITGGVTGVKGYVSEPYTYALARPEILFDRYTSGFSLAESFYMASPLVRWKDVVVGDPLCRPFTRASSATMR